MTLSINGALPALALTLVAFQLATHLHLRSCGHPLCNPVLLSVIMIIAVLAALGVPYESYFEGARALHFVLGPAVVALAVPLYRRRDTLRRLALPMLAGILAGSTAGIVMVVVLGRVLQVPEALVIALVTKSVTAPVALDIARHLDAIPALAAAMAVLTGMLVAAFGPRLLSGLAHGGSLARGLAMGVTGHGQGTARSLQESEETGAIAGLAMGMTALLSAVLIPIVWLTVMR